MTLDLSFKRDPELDTTLWFIDSNQHQTDL